jgi:hypothetical protein
MTRSCQEGVGAPGGSSHWKPKAPPKLGLPAPALTCREGQEGDVEGKKAAGRERRTMPSPDLLPSPPCASLWALVCPHA